MRTFALLSLSVCGLLLAGCGESASTTDAPGASADGSLGNGANAGNDGTGSSSESASAGSGVDADGLALTPDNTTIEFVGSKPDGSSHTGGFRDFSGRIERGPEKQAVEDVYIEILTESLWADNKKLENHLKSADFFKVREFPTALFQSTSVEAGDSGQYTVTGDLTLLGETKKISFPAEVTAEDGGWTLASSFSLDRTRFGMTYGEGEINKEVELTVTVEAAGGSEEPAQDEEPAQETESSSEEQP